MCKAPAGSDASSYDGGRSHRHDHIHLQANGFGGKLRVALVVLLRIAILNRNSAIFDPAELPQALQKCGKPSAKCGRTAAKDADCWHLVRLLRGRSERPSDGRAAEQRDEPGEKLTTEARTHKSRS